MVALPAFWQLLELPFGLGVWLGSQQLGGLLFHTEAAGGPSVWTLLVCFGASFFLGEGSSQPTTWLIFGLCQVNLLLC